jgi:predicted ATP-grasp superfamily ATP-dependent carboligase
MELRLKKDIHKPIIIQGFPSFGLIGSIITEYLIFELKAQPVGTIYSTEVSPMIAIHDQKPIYPLTLYYVESYNLILIHAIGSFVGLEYNIADVIKELCEKTNCYELISVEGIADPTKQNQTQVYSFTNHLSVVPAPKLTEGVIVGLTATLMQTISDEIRQTVLLATTHSQLPDSHAAACILRVLNEYLQYSVDPNPLETQAKVLEQKLQNMIQSMNHSADEVEKKQLTYVG